jgi:hypothetical protein
MSKKASKKSSKSPVIKGGVIPLCVANDFSKTPGPRSKKTGNYSGEEFRDLLVDRLRKAISSNKLLVIELDGTSGYAFTFLEESFGGLCRLGVFKPTEILGYLKPVSDEPKLIKEIQQIIGDALGWPRSMDLYMPTARDRTEDY